MAFTRGRCTNFDYCSIAESRKDVEVRVGEEFVCPECGKPLKAPQVKGSGSSPAVPALIGVGVLALLGGAVFLGMRMGEGTIGHGMAPAAAPAAVPAQPAPLRQAAVAPPPDAAHPPETAPASSPGAPAALPGTRTAVVAASPAAPATPTENVLFRVRGSAIMANSIVAPLAASYLTQIGDTDVSTSAQGNEIRVTGLRGALRETIAIGGDGAGAGFAALGNGGADIVMSPRRVLPAEQSSLAGLGEMTSPQAEHVLALDADAVVVNPGNAIPSLSPAQARSVFGGKIKDWRGVGGAPAAIAVYAAPADEDSVMATGMMADTPDAHHVANDVAVSKAVVGDPHGIGLVDLAAVGQARVVPIAETGATPVSPANHAAVVADDYPLAFRLYLYTSPKGSSGFAQRFVDYAMSSQGQTVVEQHGLISPTLTPREAAPVAAAAAPAPATDADRLRAFVKGAKRLSIVFRFQANSTVLDQYGERDLDRVMNYLVSLHDDGSHLLLAGFADNQGDPASNVAVSTKRADAVAALFVRRGLTPGGVQGFGAELPVADNGTEAGRQRNRRVEVYIKP